LVDGYLRGGLDRTGSTDNEELRQAAGRVLYPLKSLGIMDGDE